MKTDDKLSPCPFCGSRVDLIEDLVAPGLPLFYQVKCSNKKCLALTTFMNVRAAFRKDEREKAKTEVQKLWNRRTQKEEGDASGNPE